MQTRKSAPMLGLALATLVATSTPAVEQDAVIVTATRTAQTVDETLASVTVISRQEIDTSQARDVIDLLRLQAGVDVTRNGGPGTGSSVFLRGTNSSHTLVLIDGVRAASATLGSFAWQHLNPADIERIEIVRGPRAAQYGSDAIGGVIQIFTRQNKGSYVRAQAGSYRTRELDAGIGGGEKLKYSLNAAYRDSRGFSATNDKLASFDPDDDGYTARSISANLAYPVSDKTELEIRGWYSSSDGSYDAVDFPPPTYAATPAQGLNDNQNATLDFKIINKTSASWQQSLALGYARDKSRDTSPYSSLIETRRVMIDWQHDLTLGTNHLLTFGLSTYTDDASNIDLIGNSVTFDDSISNDALFAVLQSRIGSHDFNFSGRVDDHETFGNHTTGQLAWGYDVDTDLRLTASWGTAFRAPTFNELFWPGYGNPALNPETSETAELGLRHRFGKIQQLRLNAFHTTIDNLIQSVQIAPFTYQASNVGRARIDGLELEHDLNYSNWSVLTRLTLQKAIDESDKSDLDRRPRRKLAIQFRRKLASQGDVGLEWIYASERKDGTNTLPAYHLVNLSARYLLHKQLWLEARVDNLFDEDYELAYGYNTAGQSAYLGLSYRPEE